MKKVLVFANSRSGTNLFLNLINQHPRVRLQGEILSHKVITDDPVKLIRGYESCAIGDIFGFKLLTYQLKERFDDPAGFIRFLAGDGYRIIHIRRRNILNIALSQIHARSTGQHHYYPGKTEDKRSEGITVDIDKLLQGLRWIEKLHNLEDEILEGMEYLRVSYEDEMADDRNHQAMMDRVWSYLDIKKVKVRASIEKSIPYRLQDYVLNYAEVSGVLMETPYKQFLPED
jgi:hypothetical protein